MEKFTMLKRAATRSVELQANRLGTGVHILCGGRTTGVGPPGLIHQDCSGHGLQVKFIQTVTVEAALRGASAREVIIGYCSQLTMVLCALSHAFEMRQRR